MVLAAPGRTLVDFGFRRSSSLQSPIMSIAAHGSRNQGSQVMNTILITTQIVCYSVGIVSASLNIASFVRVRRLRRKRHERPAVQT